MTLHGAVKLRLRRVDPVYAGKRGFVFAVTEGQVCSWVAGLDTNMRRSVRAGEPPILAPCVDRESYFTVATSKILYCV